MGRSIYFKYDNVKMLEQQEIPKNVLDILQSLSKGDRFVLKGIEGYMEWCPINDEMVTPLTRAPSNYGYEELPIDTDIVYEVISENDEPTLDVIKGIRSIRFQVASEKKNRYFPTSRIMTDGTIRECEGLGILSIVQSVDLLD